MADATFSVAIHAPTHTTPLEWTHPEINVYLNEMSKQSKLFGGV